MTCMAASMVCCRVSMRAGSKDGFSNRETVPSWDAFPSGAYTQGRSRIVPEWQQSITQINCAIAKHHPNVTTTIRLGKYTYTEFHA